MRPNSRTVNVFLQYQTTFLNRFSFAKRAHLFVGPPALRRWRCQELKMPLLLIEIVLVVLLPILNFSRFKYKQFKNLSILHQIYLFYFRTAAVSFGLFSFYIAKTNIDKNRYANMKARERIRQANQEEYVSERQTNIPNLGLKK